MKTKITVGEVEILIDGLELSKRDIYRLIRLGASVAAFVAADAPEEKEEPKSLGFTAHLELDPERNLQPDLEEWFEEAP